MCFIHAAVLIDFILYCVTSAGKRKNQKCIDEKDEIPDLWRLTFKLAWIYAGSSIILIIINQKRPNLLANPVRYIRINLIKFNEMHYNY